MNLFQFLVVSLLLPVTGGSYGDHDPSYRQCMRSCTICSSSSEDTASSRTNQLVHSIDYEQFYFDYVPYVFVPHWDCIDICSYNCMHTITSERIASGYSILKYNGHWPFTRYLGLEEPASVVFSLLNAVPHFTHILNSHRNRCNSSSSSSGKASYMSVWLCMLPYVSLNAWLSSAYFHAKKTKVSSLIDYIGALILVSYSLLIAVRKLCGKKMNDIAVASLLTVWCACVAHRVNHMIYERVSFSEHMTLCITLAVIHVLVWLLYIGKEFYTSKVYNRSVWVCLICQLWFILASTLEVFDFPPYYRIFDAHSLWHAATVLLGFLWYYYWQLDLIECNNKWSK